MYLQIRTFFAIKRNTAGNCTNMLKLLLIDEEEKWWQKILSETKRYFFKMLNTTILPSEMHWGHFDPDHAFSDKWCKTIFSLKVQYKIMKQKCF